LKDYMVTPLEAFS